MHYFYRHYNYFKLQQPTESQINQDVFSIRQFATNF